MSPDRQPRAVSIAVFLGAFLASSLQPAFSRELFCPPPAVGKSLEPAATRHADGLLWRLDHDGKAPSYLFGTIHVSDPRVLSLPDPVNAAFADSREFVMEATFDPASIASFAEAMNYADGTQLQSITGAELFERTQSLLQRFYIPRSAAQHMRPWAAFLTLNQPQGDIGLPLDLVLMQQAVESDKPVHGIESLREQADVFNEFSESEQVTLLRDSVCYFDIIQDEVKKLQDLYLARNLAGIVKLTSRYEGSDPALAARMVDALIDRRNVRMAERLEPLLREGGVFIAVGALHLPGERGLIELIARQGMRVTAVY